MEQSPPAGTMTVARAAQTLRLDYHQTRALMLAGKLGVAEQRGRWWYIPISGVKEYARAATYEQAIR